VPYRIEDLIGLLDERMGKLENRNSRMVYHKLIGRIQTFRNHPRYAFMFENANIGGDTMAEILAHLFRLPPQGKPDDHHATRRFPGRGGGLGGVVLCRMAFDFGLWSDGVAPLLVRLRGSAPLRARDKANRLRTDPAVRSRASQGRPQYGVFLGLVTARPAENRPDHRVQCSTFSSCGCRTTATRA